MNVLMHILFRMAIARASVSAADTARSPRLCGGDPFSAVRDHWNRYGNDRAHCTHRMCAYVITGLGLILIKPLSVVMLIVAPSVDTVTTEAQE